MSAIPVTDLGHLYRRQADELDRAALGVLRGGRYVRGAEVDAFEREFARYTGSPAAVGVGSGLDAVRLALLGLGIGPGDEVIVPGHTAIATWLAVSATGARVVPVDVDETTMLMAGDAVRAALTPRTAAIVAVHLYGLVAPIASIARLARDRGLALVEDASQAHGAAHGDAQVGTVGDAGAFSLYPTKNLGAAGDGGIVVTADPRLSDRVRLLGSYGQEAPNASEVLGLNSRLDEVQAAILRVRLRLLDEINACRRDRATRYRHALRGRPGIGLPAPAPGTRPVWHQFVVTVEHRDAVREAMRERGVQALVHYPRAPHQAPAYATVPAGSLPVTERLAGRVLSIPVGPHVDDRAGERVCEALVSSVEAVAEASCSARRR